MTAGGSVGPVSASPLAFHLLEVTLISAQDLHPADCCMQAYAVAWVHPDRKLRTRVDPAGGTDPNWNDKFVFRVDDAFLKSDTSAVSVDIFSSRRLRRDHLVGTVRLVVSSVGPSRATRFVALQVRRPRSLRPQGILNVGIALVDAYMYTMRVVDDDDNAAFALKDLVDGPMRNVGHTTCNEDDGCDKEEKRNYMSRNGSRNVWNKEEVEEMESKLEKWRIELSPSTAHHAERAPGSRRAQRRTLSCFCSGDARD